MGGTAMIAKARSWGKIYNTRTAGINTEYAGSAGGQVAAVFMKIERQKGKQNAGFVARSKL
jgi:hypothetical protein